MSELEKKVFFNANTVRAMAQGIEDDVYLGDWDSATMGLDELFKYASRLMKNLEELEG